MRNVVDVILDGIALCFRKPARLTSSFLNMRHRLFHGIALKLSLLTMSLVALVAAASSLVLIDIMDEIMFRSLVQRGSAIAQTAATPAGYSILSEDRLALDNLAVRLKQSQDDLLYVAILDRSGSVLAHDRMGRVGRTLAAPAAAPMEKEDHFRLFRTRRDGRDSYEVSAPVSFSGKTIGQVIVGIDAGVFAAAKKSARNRILFVSWFVALAGALVAMNISRFFSRPIKRLSEGVGNIRSGNYQVRLPVQSQDELGELTENFNEMVRVIGEQRDGLETSYRSTIRILAASLDARDNYTLGHSARVAQLALLVGRRQGLTELELKELEMACFLHDIGKIRIPDEVLNKEAPLDVAERKLVSRHPEHGVEILSLAESLHKYIPVVEQHHEWHNGEGYPRGIRGDEIHPFARIVAIADAYDAMTSSRPYRIGLGREEAVKEILRFRGTQFAPQLVDVFLEALPEFDEGQQVSLFGAAV